MPYMTLAATAAVGCGAVDTWHIQPVLSAAKALVTPSKLPNCCCMRTDASSVAMDCRFAVVEEGNASILLVAPHHLRVTGFDEVEAGVVLSCLCSDLAALQLFG